MIDRNSDGSSEGDSESSFFNFVQSESLKIRKEKIWFTLPNLTDLLYLTVLPLTTGLKVSDGLGNYLAALAFLALSLLYLRAG
jgi:hypothetical protein